jgi:hypothetical protein
MKGRKPWNTGKQATPEAKANQSKSLLGKPWSEARRAAHDAKKRS